MKTKFSVEKTWHFQMAYYMNIAYSNFIFIHSYFYLSIFTLIEYQNNNYKPNTDKLEIKLLVKSISII